MAVAKAECTCKECGRKFEVRAVRYNRRDANSFESWAAENITVCNDCKKKQADAAHREENTKAAQTAKENGRPDLSGSEKQIAWATTIRENILAILAQYFLDAERLKRRPHSRYEYAVLMDILLSRRSASWWIDNRNAMDVRSVILLASGIDKEKCIECTNVSKAIEAGEKSLEDALNELKTA